VFNLIGSASIKVIRNLGHFGLFCLNVLKTLATQGFNPHSTFFQMNHIGVNSGYVVIITGLAIGAVLALHSYNALHRFNGEQFIGSLIYFSMTREFGAMISAIMVAARAGSSITAEIGTMQISEQVDALTTLSINPIRYLVTPRVVATTLILPALSLFCMLFGVGAGFVVSVFAQGVNAELYAESIKSQLVLSDIMYGLLKASVFGFLCSLISTYKGMQTRGGARGVGIATTESVVASCVTIFVANYLLTAFLFPV
jgi:phospholipid/cholesterol/gamma-HCH transport system permease protein